MFYNIPHSNPSSLLTLIPSLLKTSLQLLLLLVCGDIHPHPGPTMIWNLTDPTQIPSRKNLFRYGNRLENHPEHQDQFLPALRFNRNGQNKPLFTRALSNRQYTYIALWDQFKYQTFERATHSVVNHLLRKNLLTKDSIPIVHALML